MSLRGPVNRALLRATGYELRRPRAGGPGGRAEGPAPGDRLLREPAFVLSGVRSGSTLLRVLLDSHSQIHAPPELHLRNLAVRVRTKYAARAIEEIGLDKQALRYLLWDRLLHRELAESGKTRLVHKTPNQVFIADKLAECWPDARFIFLLRHPQAIANSRRRARPQDSDERNLRRVLKYATALDGARTRHDGLTVRYEELTRDPEGQTRRICEHLGLDWEPAMLDYGRYDHGSLKPGLGDWTENIRSGRVKLAAPVPAAADTAPELRPLAERWGY